MKRRNFLKKTSITGLCLAVSPAITSCATDEKKSEKTAVTRKSIIPI